MAGAVVAGVTCRRNDKWERIDAMENVQAIVLRAAGVNCDVETQYALELAGARAERIHINRLIEDPAPLDRCQILVFPGGFSYGDDVAAGKILANQVIYHLAETIRRCIDDGKLVLGICNGFQVLVKAGILPGLAQMGFSFENQPVSITDNDSGKYEDRWVYLQPGTDRCVFLDADRRIYLPVAHGEGKLVTRDASILERLRSEGHVAFRYVDAQGDVGDFPINPNGSVDSIAGLTDATGRVLGLMPHPERFVHSTQHPHWTRLEEPQSDGMMIFDNAVRYVRENM
ncbi:MAG: phosphoribosylformylglycinamidine synthase I [Sedimentisphaerales bacterium]|nr:phosphoribosylformylglycinamidine synthase I [Sedimentisphaerales bacterium]